MTAARHAAVLPDAPYLFERGKSQNPFPERPNTMTRTSLGALGLGALTVKARRRTV